MAYTYNIKTTAELNSIQPLPTIEKVNVLKIVECPRDAMQGWPNLIPTTQKIKYLNALLECGFDTLDFGSFVSPKAIPQMADTKEVIAGLRMENTTTKLLAIIANQRGAADAVSYEHISYLGYPFSVSETFQWLNTNSTIETSLKTVQNIQELCIKNNKQLVVYMSMGFGNPYGDVYNESILVNYTKQIEALGVKIISIADTVGLATADDVKNVLHHLIPAFEKLQIGVHLHSAPQNRMEKLQAALVEGCTRFDSAIKGIGGCPMAGNALVGNMDTEVMLQYFESKGYVTNISKEALQKCAVLANKIFV